MKNLFKTSFILLALMGVLFTSCKKDYEVPPIPVLPVGDLYTIGDLLAMPSNTSFDTASVCGIVTADEQSGNLYKTIFIQDRKTGKAIELLMNTSSAARIGDSVRVFLDKNMMVNNYHNLPQIVGADGKGFSPDGHLIIYPFNKPIEPATVTIADIKTGNFIAGLVKLNDVEFTEQGSAFCNPGENTNRNLKDATGEIIVRTSNYANFAYDLMPSGKGSVVAIASVYNSDWQLVLRSKKDMHFEGGEPTPPAPPGEVQHLPYTQSFTSDFGTYKTYDLLGEQSWMIDYSTAKITGHVGGNPGENYANDDWLISSPVDLTGVRDVKMTMTYIGRYFTNINNEVTVWGSKDYTYGDDPTTANWEQITATLTEGSNWNDFLTTEISLDAYAGQTATFAVRYTSTDQKAGTMEIQSITIEEGGGVGPTPPPGPAGEVQDMPYTQSFATEFGSYTTYDVSGPQSWMIDYSTAKMTGYSGGSHANEDWLLSSPVAVTGVSHAKVSVTYSAQYQNSDANDVTLQVSSDYVFGNAPSSANWTTMSTTYPNTSSFNDFKTVETSLDEFIGQNVTVAIRYTSTDAQSRTIEIQSITVQEGEAGGGTPPTPPPGPGTGSGTQNDPYNVVSGINLQGQNVTAWVQGYIVGSVKDGNNSVSSNDQINWSAPFDLKTNVLIADDPTCHEITNCVIVNLPNNKPLRTEVNLVDHPDNLGKQLTVLGTLRTYFGQAGLRDSNGTENDFILEGGGTPPTPPPTGEVQSLPYIQSFASDFGTYTTYDVLGSQSWGIDYSTAKMTGFINNNGQYEYYANEDWLISSPFEVPTGSFMLLSMTVECLGRYFDDINNEVTFWVTSGYEFGTDPTQINWIQLPCTLNEASSWDDFQTVTVDLSIIGQLMSETATIAVKYTSTDQVAGTIEIKKITIE